MTNDRCDIEFTYGWKTINHYLDYLSETPTYLVNAGDDFSISFKSITPNKVSFVTNSYNLEMTQDNFTWSVKIPTDYTNQEAFSIVINDNYVLYQGLLNNNQSNEEFASIIRQHTFDILELQTQVKTNTDNIADLEARVKALEEKVK